MKVSKNEARSSTRTIPEIRFADQELTSFSGLILFQRLFDHLGLRQALRRCFSHVRTTASYAPSTVAMLLIVHLLLGWRRLRDLDYYRDDPLVRRVVGLSQLPSVSTVSRVLRDMDQRAVENFRAYSRQIVLDRLQSAGLRLVTLDFDGSVISTRSRNTEGTAVGFNKKHKGDRSYYPLFCTIPQLQEILDVHHRPGNVHDSNGAKEFIASCLRNLSESGFRGTVEARLDSAHYSDETCRFLDDARVKFSISVPFERFADLKEKIEGRVKWTRIDDRWSYFELDWKPKNWSRTFRIVCYRQEKKVPRKGPIQLDIFEPTSRTHEYKAVVTNKGGSARSLLEFHNGRGSQEAIFGEAKPQLAMAYLPTRRLYGNQIHLFASVLAYNLNRELQIETSPRLHQRNTVKRAALWLFEKADTIRRRLIQRAGRLTRPAGVLTLTMSTNEVVESEFQGMLENLSPAN